MLTRIARRVAQLQPQRPPALAIWTRELPCREKASNASSSLSGKIDLQHQTDFFTGQADLSAALHRLRRHSAVVVVVPEPRSISGLN